MKKKLLSILSVALIASFFAPLLRAQEATVKTYNTLTFFYLDNSEGLKTEALNIDMQNKIKEKLTETVSRSDYYFFAYTANGKHGKPSSNLQTFLDNGFKKYVQKNSEEPDFPSERQAIRDYFNDNPIRIKQAVEFNIFLSANAVKNILNETSSLPTPIMMPQELVLYLNSTQLKVKVNFFANKEIISEKLTELQIKESLLFCGKELKLDNNTYTFSFL